MADPNLKKFIIIPEGTTLFPETGKKRVRVFEDDKIDPELLDAAEALKAAKALKAYNTELRAAAQAMGTLKEETEGNTAAQEHNKKVLEELQAELSELKALEELQAELKKRDAELTETQAKRLAELTEQHK